MNINNEESLEQKVDILRNLQPEEMQEICMYLEPKDVLKVSCASPYWRSLLNDEYFWKMKCEQENFRPENESSKSLFYREFDAKFDHWQATYLYNQALNYNWDHNIFQEVLLGKGGPLQDVHYFDDEVVVASTRDRKIKMFNSSTGVLENRFSIDCEGRILDIKMQDNLLVCVTQKQAMAWNIQSGEVLGTWTWESNGKHALEVQIQNNLIVVILENYNYRTEVYILNVEYVDNTIHSNIERGSCQIYAYNNMVAYLESNNSASVLNTHDLSVTRLFCYSDSHLVSKIMGRNKYVVGLCKSVNHIHFSVWNTESSELIRFIEINNPLDQLNLWFPPMVFALLEPNKLAYYCHQGLNQYITVTILDYLSGEHITRIDFDGRKLLYPLVPIIPLNNYILLKCKKLRRKYMKMFCASTGKFIRNFSIYNDEDFLTLGMVTFTRTKKLRVYKSGSKKYFRILNFENKIENLMNFE